MPSHCVLSSRTGTGTIHASAAAGGVAANLQVLSAALASGQAAAAGAATGGAAGLGLGARRLFKRKPLPAGDISIFLYY